MSFSSSFTYRAIGALVVAQMTLGSVVSAQTVSSGPNYVELSSMTEAKFHQDMAKGLDEVRQKFDAMTDQELAAKMNARADELDHYAKQKPELLKAEKELRDMAVEQLSNKDSKHKPRAKIRKFLRETGQTAKILGEGFLEGTGYISAAVTQVMTVPLRFIYKFFRGMITNKSSRPQYTVTLSGYVSIDYLVGAELLSVSNPAAIVGGIFLIAATTELIADTICSDAGDDASPVMKHFCTNLDGINKLGYEASGEGDQLGVEGRAGLIVFGKDVKKEAQKLFKKKDKDAPTTPAAAPSPSPSPAAPVETAQS